MSAADYNDSLSLFAPIPLQKRMVHVNVRAFVSHPLNPIKNCYILRCTWMPPAEVAINPIFPIHPGFRINATSNNYWTRDKYRFQLSTSFLVHMQRDSDSELLIQFHRTPHQYQFVQWTDMWTARWRPRTYPKRIHSQLPMNTNSITICMETTFLCKAILEIVFWRFVYPANLYLPNPHNKSSVLKLCNAMNVLLDHCVNQFLKCIKLSTAEI